MPGRMGDEAGPPRRADPEHTGPNRFDPGRLDALRRIAFGRADTEEGQRRAAEAQQQLATIESERPAPVAEGAQADDAAAARLRSGLPRVLISLTIAVAVVGAAAVAVSSTMTASTRADLPPQQVSPHPESTGAGPRRIPVGPVTTGSAASAEDWFAAAQEESDRVGVLRGLDPASTRLVPTGAEGWSVWVAKNVDGGLCLVLRRTGHPATSMGCATPDDFDASGLTVASGGIVAFWDGFELTTRNAPGGGAATPAP